MDKKRIITAVTLFFILVVLLMIFSLLFYRESISGAFDDINVQQNEELQNISTMYSQNDRDILEDVDNARVVEFKGEEIERYEINSNGQYILRGNLTGNVHINADDAIVHIVLDGLSVKSDAGPAILVNSAGKVIITVREGTENSLRDSTNYRDYSNSKACIYSGSDLTINGDGSLYVYGDYKGGVRTRGVLRVLNTDLKIRSKSDGLRGNDGVYISLATMSVESERSGIVTTVSKNEKGDVSIEGGKVSIIAGEYGIDSVGKISIRDCDDNIYGVLSGVNQRNI